MGVKAIKTENRTENTTGEVLPIESMSMSKTGSQLSHKIKVKKPQRIFERHQDVIYSLSEGRHGAAIKMNVNFRIVLDSHDIC